LVFRYKLHNTDFLDFPESFTGINSTAMKQS